MRSCVFPGSFDPVTRGHLDLIRRAAELFDRVTVTVMINIGKTGALTTEERLALLKKACADLPSVRIDSWSGLLADYMRKNGEVCVIRGIRNAAELEQEMISARINRLLNPPMETVFLPATDELSCVSSSAVREIAAFGGDITPFVPETVGEEIRRLLEKSRRTGERTS